MIRYQTAHFAIPVRCLVLISKMPATFQSQISLGQTLTQLPAFFATQIVLAFQLQRMEGHITPQLALSRGLAQLQTGPQLLRIGHFELQVQSGCTADTQVALQEHLVIAQL